eukprot:2366165-Pyramimonas_sp.AAC.1
MAQTLTGRARPSRARRALATPENKIITEKSHGQIKIARAPPLAHRPPPGPDLPAQPARGSQ